MDTSSTRAEATEASKVSETESCCRPSASARTTEMTEASTVSQASLGQDWLSLLRYWLRNRRVLVAIALAVVIGGAVLNWSWLVAIGLAPILLAMAPCAVMCAVGACSMRKGKGESADGKDASERDDSLPANQMVKRRRTSGSE